MIVKSNQTLFKYHSKSVARKAYNDGETIIIVPHKISPESYYNLDMDISATDWIGTNEEFKDTNSFDYRVQNYTTYNCNYECGYYCAYYVVVTKKD